MKRAASLHALHRRCPVDAIAGAQGFMQTVIAPIAPGRNCACRLPVDCIDMVAPPGPWTAADARDAKRRAARRKHEISEKARKTTTVDRKAIIAAALKHKSRA